MTQELSWDDQLALMRLDDDGAPCEPNDPDQLLTGLGSNRPALGIGNSRTGKSTRVQLVVVEACELERVFLLDPLGPLARKVQLRFASGETGDGGEEK